MMFEFGPPLIECVVSDGNFSTGFGDAGAGAIFRND
jgi:hypothetical protein